MVRLYNPLRNALAGLALTVAAVGGAQAVTVDVTVGTDVFTIGTITGSFAENQAELELQPWWGDVASATEFALLVSDGLGLPNDSTPFLSGTPTHGPLFAVSTIGDLGGGPFDPDSILSRALLGSSVNSSVIAPSTSATYAVVDSVAPIPLPPAALLLLGAFGVAGVVKRRAARAA